MATTDYDFSLTRAKIIEQAYIKIGALGLGQTLPGEMSVQGSLALNMLVKEWQTKDIFLWQLVQGTTVFAADTTSKAMDNSVLGVEKAWYKSGTNDVEISVISYRRYLEEIAKEVSSQYPYYIAVDNHITTPTMYIWPQPTAELTVYHLTITRLKDMDTSGATPDVPQRFYMALVYGLATILADDFGLPVRERDYIKSQYNEYLFEAMKSDREFEDITVSEPAYDS